MLKSVIST